MGVDYTKLSPELIKKIQKWESNQPAQKQLVALTDLNSMIQELINMFDDNSNQGKKFNEDLGAVLIDMRESLSSIKAKDVKIPDYAKPVVKGLEQLEKAIKKIEVKPEFKPEIKVDSPAVNVSPPSVDLKGIEKVLKSEMPKAFEKAIKAIPELEIPEQKDYSEQFTSMLEQLASIDTASRMKPQEKVYATNSSNQLIVDTDSAGGALVAGSDYDYIDVQQTSTTVDTFVFKTGGSGGTTVQTIVLTFTSAAKTDIDSVAWS